MFVTAFEVTNKNKNELNYMFKKKSQQEYLVDDKK